MARSAATARCALGIAEPALLADADRPGLPYVAVGVDELGGDEHGLAVALGGLARGLA